MKIKHLSPYELSRLKAGENPCRVLREERGEGISQQKLASLIGKDASRKSYICRLESGQFVGSIGVWWEICQLFRASLDDIAPYIRQNERAHNNRKRAR